MTDFSNIKEMQNNILDLLPRAGQIVRRFFHAENLSQEKKGIHDVVTAADLTVNNFLQKELKQAYPDIPILTEEAVQNINQYAQEKLVWIIDPLDGTANLSRGDDNFSISVALVSEGKTLLGAIFAPISSRLFWANCQEEFAFWNGRRIKVSDVDKLEEAVVCTDWSHLLETRDATTNFLKKIYGKVRQIKILGSAATDITLLAKGQIDIYYHVRLFPWDVAAAGFIAQKAGAKVTDIDGSKWQAFSPGIFAANPKLHQSLSDLLILT